MKLKKKKKRRENAWVREWGYTKRETGISLFHSVGALFLLLLPSSLFLIAK